jgi:hypothetical protein
MDGSLKQISKLTVKLPSDDGTTATNWFCLCLSHANAKHMSNFFFETEHMSNFVWLNWLFYCIIDLQYLVPNIDVRMY